jgi:hypothetical protein
VTKEFPLVWPDGWPRTTARKAAAFKTYGSRIEFSSAERRARHELRLMGYDDHRESVEVILSSNVLRAREPADPGAALYFQKPGTPMRVIAIDLYLRAADNVAAIAATLEALRAIERHGGGQILERAFTGFDALPPPGARPWRQVMGFARDARVSLADIESTFRALARRHHPDNGGDAGMMQELNQARDDARKELGG